MLEPFVESGESVVTRTNSLIILCLYHVNGSSCHLGMGWKYIIPVTEKFYFPKTLVGILDLVGKKFQNTNIGGQPRMDFNMSYRLFLDDSRDPTQVFRTTKNSEWVIARTYEEFVKIIERDGLPFICSLDHDLASEHYRTSMYAPDKHYSNYYHDGTFKEKTGYHAAKWLVEYCHNKNLDLPQWSCHSQNPIGKENIIATLTAYEESRLFEK
jgi:hypothetical protein